MPSKYFLAVAGLTLRLEADCVLSAGDAFRPFLAVEATEPDIRITFHRVENLPLFWEQVLYESSGYRIHPDGHGGYLRSFFNPTKDMAPYAVAIYDYSGGSIRVEYLDKGKQAFSQMQNSFFHVGIESVMLYRGRMCFHAACVRTERGGILFSGPSGIGKSTQAALWCKYRDAEQINGDRPILSKREGQWLAWGSPYAGSSRCYVNDSSPIRAIVMLCQAESCSLRRLSIKEAFRAVWSGLTVPAWDPKATEAACDLALDLSAAVPVYEFGCTPDAAAVEFLEQGLGKDGAL